jgi:hypothetical protein
MFLSSLRGELRRVVNIVIRGVIYYLTTQVRYSDIFNLVTAPSQKQHEKFGIKIVQNLTLGKWEKDIHQMNLLSCKIVIKIIIMTS